MRRHVIHATVFALFLGSGAAAAQAQVCVRIDESHDTLGRDDRTAAVLLLNRQFASAGEQVVADCATPYVLAHVKLGNTITVTLSGPKGNREGTALGLDDLPALYSQMVRSLETGRPMTGFAVVDRTNVTAAQASAQRVHSDGFFYARLGYGSIFAGGAYGVPSFGLGYRAELDKVAIDVSFLNFQVSNYDYSSASASADSASLLKLSGLYMIRRDANSTPYFGGGLSWGHTSINANQPVTVGPTAPGTPPVYSYRTGGDSSGLQSELTAGYEFARATTIRMFVQADAILPFYSVTTQTISSRGVVSSSSSQWTPSLVMSVGLGWQRNRK
jgi:hypothetical protein